MRTDRRRTDMTKLIVAFRKFAYAPKNSTSASTRHLRLCGTQDEQRLQYFPVRNSFVLMTETGNVDCAVRAKYVNINQSKCLRCARAT